MHVAERSELHRGSMGSFPPAERVSRRLSGGAASAWREKSYVSDNYDVWQAHLVKLSAALIP
jgi:hypothetical protein